MVKAPESEFPETAMFCPYPPPPAVLFCISIIFSYIRKGENLQIMGEFSAATLLSGVVSKGLIPGHGASLMTSTSIVVCSDTSWAESIGSGGSFSSSCNRSGGACSYGNNLGGSSFSGSNNGGSSFGGSWSGGVGSWSLGFGNDNNSLGSCSWCRGRGGLRVRVSVRSRLSWGSDSHDNGSGGGFGSSSNDDWLSSDSDHDHVCNDINMCLDDLNGGSGDLKTLLDEGRSSCKGSAEGSDSD